MSDEPRYAFRVVDAGGTVLIAQRGSHDWHVGACIKPYMGRAPITVEIRRDDGVFPEDWRDTLPNSGGGGA